MEFFPCRVTPTRGGGSSASALILPALSAGNAGQLAVDLLISSLRLEKEGCLHHPFLLPCVGNDPFGPEASGELTVAMEVYESSDLGLQVVQQRSPVVKGSMLRFAKDIALWAHDTTAKEVIILSGIDSSRRCRHDISPQIYYISSTNMDGTDEQYEHLGWKRLELFNSLSEAWKELEARACKEIAEDDQYHEVPMNDEAYLPSMPFASLFCCCKARGLKTTCVLCFCSEGDNVADAVLLSDSVSNLLHLPRRGTGEGLANWVIPLSWKTVYGPPPDLTIF